MVAMATGGVGVGRREEVREVERREIYVRVRGEGEERKKECE